MSFVKPEPGRYPRFAPDAELVVNMHNGDEVWTGTQWNGYVASAERNRNMVTARLVECPAPLEHENCARCHAPAFTVCCSSHGKHLCHLCYRRTHFVEVCVEGCSQCAAEGLPVRLSEIPTVSR